MSSLPQNPPSVSVIMTSFNGGPFIRQQLASLATQSLRPLELVVCDDGSTDDTLAIVTEFQRDAPFPVRIQHNPIRLGATDNFLQGCALATGDLIACCDQDDVWESAKLERCVDAFVQNAGVLLAIHSVDVVDEALRPCGYCKPDDAVSRLRRPRGGELDFSLPGCAMVFSPDLVRSIDWRMRARDYMHPDRPLMAHDQWLLFLAFSLGRVAQISDPLALYRQHSGSNSSATGVVDDLLPALRRAISQAANRQCSDACDYNGQFLLTLAARVPGDQGAILRASAGDYFRQAVTYQTRERLYHDRSNLSGRIFAYIALWRRGAYRSRRAGGMGWRTAVTDARAVVLSEDALPLSVR